MAKGLKFRIWGVEGLYFLCSENKGADQLPGYREADLCLCFCICKKSVFLRPGSNSGFYESDYECVLWDKMTKLTVRDREDKQPILIRAKYESYHEISIPIASVKPLFSDHIKQDIFLAFQTGGNIAA